MVQKITLHIGTEKTGTTSIQYALAHDRAALKQNGVLVPYLFDSENHMELAVYAMEDEVNDELRQFELGKAKCDISEYRKRLSAKLRQEIAESGCHTLLLSNEHCHSRLTSGSAVERLKALLHSISSNVEVIVYLRRQDLLAVSLYSTRLKLGDKYAIFPDTQNAPLPDYFCYDTLLARYAAAFGKTNLRVRLFEGKQLVGGDVVSDFYALTQLPVDVPTLPKANKSLSLKQGLFLERFNSEFPLFVDGMVNPLRGAVFHIIETTLSGAPYGPPKAVARAFYEAFREGNEAVRHAYFANL
jgi:hypothetical protein